MRHLKQLSLGTPLSVALAPVCVAKTPMVHTYPKGNPVWRVPTGGEGRTGPVRSEARWTRTTDILLT